MATTKTKPTDDLTRRRERGGCVAEQVYRRSGDRYSCSRIRQASLVALGRRGRLCGGRRGRSDDVRGARRIAPAPAHHGVDGARERKHDLGARMRTAYGRSRASCARTAGSRYLVRSTLPARGSRGTRWATRTAPSGGRADATDRTSPCLAVLSRGIARSAAWHDGLGTSSTRYTDGVRAAPRTDASL